MQICTAYEWRYSIPLAIPTATPNRWYAVREGLSVDLSSLVPVKVHVAILVQIATDSVAYWTMSTNCHSFHQHSKST